MREAIHAGSFYPAEEKELSEMIDSLLKENKSPAFDGKIYAAIVPHAGYAYSGPVAATVYNALKKTSVKNVVLVGPSHQEALEGAVTFKEDWSTPLGTINVKPIEGLENKDNDFEHSLEVQVPFMQKVFGKFTLQPIMYGQTSGKELFGILEGTEKSLIVVSSDLSHYHPYETAIKKDKTTINAILSLDSSKLLKTGDACGITGILALIMLAKKHKWKPLLLDYRNSGDTAGDKSEVVGYAGIIFTE